MERLKEFIGKFTPYLEDIRRRLYTTAVLFAVSFVAGFISAAPIIKYIISFFDIKGVIIATTSPYQFADLAIDVGLMTACVIIFPVLIFHAYSFLKPALSKGERRAFFSFIPLSLFLFVLGFLYGFAILYYALIILAQINISIGVQNIWDVGMFLSQIMLTATLLGALFEYPIVMTYIIKTGILSVDMLRKKRRIAVFIIFVFTTLLPPTDGLSLLAMALPLILLYEVTIFVNSRTRRVIEV